MKHSLEHRFHLWNDDRGERVEIGDDPDGLEMTEIVFVTDDGMRGNPINFTEEGLPLLIEALTLRLQHLQSKKK